MVDGGTGSQVVHRQPVAGEHWEVPVEHAHAAFDRALSGFDGAPARAAVVELAARRRAQEQSGAG